jgi:hypothetical protein
MKDWRTAGHEHAIQHDAVNVRVQSQIRANALRCPLHAAFLAGTTAIAGAIAALATFHWRIASRQGVWFIVNRSHVPT